jgi:hypothetical protein
MNTKILFSLCAAGLLTAAAVTWAQSTTGQAAASDPRIDKVIEQNEKILKNQEDILKKLDELQNGITILKRRSS